MVIAEGIAVFASAFLIIYQSVDWRITEARNFNDAIKEAKGFNKFLKRKFRRSDSDYIGNMNHIHVNLAYVSNIFSKLINADDGGELIFMSF